MEAIFNLGLCCRRMAELERVIGQNQNYVNCVLAALQVYFTRPSISPVHLFRPSIYFAGRPTKRTYLKFWLGIGAVCTFRG